MSLLPERASYFEEVQACFLAFRGDGLALSAQDVGLVFEWHARQIPSDVICRGIRRAAERAVFDARVTSRPRSLRACRREIDREIARHLAASAGRAAVAAPPEDVWSGARALGEARGALAGALCARPGAAAESADFPESELFYARARLSGARHTLDALSSEGRLPQGCLDFLGALLDVPREFDAPPTDLDERLARFEAALAIFSLRAQPFAVRSAAVRRARLSAGPRPRLASPRARQQILRHHLLAEIRALGLPGMG